MGAGKKKQVQVQGERGFREPLFWRDLLLYSLAFSYIGHFIEMGWSWVCHWFFGGEVAHNILANAFEPYTIYGAGAVLCILIVRPLVKKFDHNIFMTFLITTVVCAALELVSSVVLVARYGANPYWWYADRPFNLGGHIWLGNCLLFGLLATVFLRVVYPLTERLLRKGNQAIINIVLLVLVAMFAVYYLL